MAQWYFRKQVPGEKVRQPIGSEFFTRSNDDENPARAIVREAIQNSLDAATGETVRVRIHLSGRIEAAKAPRYEKFFRDSWAHFHCKEAGLISPPSDGVDCPYMVIEDFGTTGLDGDVSQWSRKEGAANPWFHFWHAEGLSGKDSKSRGSWGLGKFVFPRASQLKTFFAISVRNAEMRPLLMGQSILRSHSIGDDSYTPDGLFGTPDMSAEDQHGHVLPVSDDAVIEQFLRCFKATRRTEPGLSVIVPFYNLEITREKVIEAVIEEYFLPVVSGRLAVTISHASDPEISVDSASVRGLLKRTTGAFRARAQYLVQLAEALCSSATRWLIIEASEIGGSPRWDKLAFDKQSARQLRNSLLRGEVLPFEVRLVVRRKGGDAEKSTFRILIQGTGDEQRHRPVCVREGLVISEVKSPFLRGHVALLAVDHGPMSELLRACENPAHTEWRKDTGTFRQKYANGPSTVDFVVNAPVSIFNELMNSEGEEDDEVLADIFSIAIDSTGETSLRKKRSVRDEDDEEPVDPDSSLGTEPTPEDLPRRKVRFRVRQEAGGFVVKRGDEDAPLPSSLNIEVAYNVRNGNPFKKYHPADFEFGRGGVNVKLAESKGIDVTARDHNKLAVRITKPDFLLMVGGFDELRDLCIRVTAKEDEDDPQV